MSTRIFAIATVSSALNLAAFLLLLLGTLSGLYIKGLTLLLLPYVPDPNPITHDIRAGVLGFCDTNIVALSDCYGPQLGYTIPSDVVTRHSLPSTVALMLNPAFMALLVFHPLGTAFIGLCTVLSLFIANRICAVLALVLAVGAAKFAVLAFIFDVLIVTRAKSLVDEGFLVVYWGAVPWMTLVAALLIGVSVLLLCLAVFHRKP